MLINRILYSPSKYSRNTIYAPSITLLMRAAFITRASGFMYIQEPTGDFREVSGPIPPLLCRLSNITALVVLSNITALLPSPHPHPELIRSQQETVRCMNSPVHETSKKLCPTLCKASWSRILLCGAVITARARTEPTGMTARLPKQPASAQKTNEPR